MQPGSGVIPSASWLQQLRPDIQPPAAGFWPPAPDLLLTSVIVIAVFLMALLYFYYQRRPQVRLRKQGLLTLKQLQLQLGQDPCLAQELEHLLRRYAQVRYGTLEVAALSGEKWLNFLVAHGAIAFAGNVGDDFLRSAYRGEPPVNAELASVWCSAAEQFMRHRQ